jgi:hypothetical protein
MATTLRKSYKISHKRVSFQGYFNRVFVSNEIKITVDCLLYVVGGTLATSNRNMASHWSERPDKLKLTLQVRDLYYYSCYMCSRSIRSNNINRDQKSN